MEWKDVGGAIKKFAPILGTVIGGPAGGALGGVVSTVASAFGLGEEEATPQKLSDIISSDPEAAIKLKQIESEHKIELEKLAFQMESIRLADTQNARKREMDIVKATGKRDWNLYALSWIVVAGFFSLCAMLMVVSLPKGQNEVIFMLFGALSSGFGQVLQYFFGSSKSSTDKTKLMSGKGI